MIDHTFCKTALSHDPRLPSCILQEAAHVFGTVIGGEAVFFLPIRMDFAVHQPSASLSGSLLFRCMSRLVSPYLCSGLCFSPASVSDFWHLTSHDLAASKYLCKYHGEAQFSVLDSWLSMAFALLSLPSLPSLQEDQAINAYRIFGTPFSLATLTNRAS